MWKEFKTFVNQGNAMDLAVGVVIGAAFGKIVNSLVNDLIMPLVGLALGKVDFRQLFVALNGKTYENLAAAQDSSSSRFQCFWSCGRSIDGGGERRRRSDKKKCWVLGARCCVRTRTQHLALST